MSENRLTPEQVDQLVEAASQEACASWTALRTGPRFSPEQQQKLVDGVSKSAVFAASTLIDVSWLTDSQKSRLKLVS